MEISPCKICANEELARVVEREMLNGSGLRGASKAIGVSQNKTLEHTHHLSEELRRRFRAASLRAAAKKISAAAVRFAPNRLRKQEEKQEEHKRREQERLEKKQRAEEEYKLAVKARRLEHAQRRKHLVEERAQRRTERTMQRQRAMERQAAWESGEKGPAGCGSAAVEARGLVSLVGYGGETEQTIRKSIRISPEQADFLCTKLGMPEVSRLIDFRGRVLAHFDRLVSDACLREKIERRREEVIRINRAMRSEVVEAEPEHKGEAEEDFQAREEQEAVW